MFLTSEEVEVLTGDTRAFMQIRWLIQRNWIFEISGSGAPVISRSYAERRLGATDTPTRAKARVNLEAV